MGHTPGCKTWKWNSTGSSRGTNGQRNSWPKWSPNDFNLSMEVLVILITTLTIWSYPGVTFFFWPRQTQAPGRVGVPVWLFLALLNKVFMSMGTYCELRFAVWAQSASWGQGQSIALVCNHKIVKKKHVTSKQDCTSSHPNLAKPFSTTFFTTSLTFFLPPTSPHLRYPSYAVWDSWEQES